MFGRLSLILFSGFLFSCAQPTYIDPKASSADITQNKQQGYQKFNRSGLNLYWVWEKDPKGAEEGVLLFRVFSPSTLDSFPEAKEVVGGFSVWLRMPEMGHGSSPTAVERVLDDQGKIITGAYRVRGVYFIMPGKWDIHFDRREEGATDDVAVISLQRDP